MSIQQLKFAQIIVIALDQNIVVSSRAGDPLIPLVVDKQILYQKGGWNRYSITAVLWEMPN